MTDHAAKPYERRCPTCGQMYRTDVAGARWFNRKHNPRYIHPGCEQPAKDWKPADSLPNQERSS